MPDDPIQLSEVIQEERCAILDSEADRPLSALCISGGGIRSATFALGALQSLAKNGLLPGFDYLSTVSGGGYIGSWLSAWITREGDIKKVIPRLDSVAPPPPPGEPDPVQHLRIFNNYLTPKVGGLSEDTWTVIATVIRNIVLNWLVLIPLLLSFLMVPRMLLSVARLPYFLGPARAIALWPTLQQAMPIAYNLLFCLALWNILRYLPCVGGVNHTSSAYKRWVLVPLILASFLFCSYAALYFMYDEEPNRRAAQYLGVTFVPALLTWAAYLGAGAGTSKRRLQLSAQLSLAIVLVALVQGLAEWMIAAHLVPHMSWSSYITTVPPLMALGCYAAMVAFAGFSSTYLQDSDREWMARASADLLLFVVVWLAGSFTVLIAPELVFTGNVRLTALADDHQAQEWITKVGGALVSAVSVISGWITAKNAGKDNDTVLGRMLVTSVAPVAFVVSLGVVLTIVTNRVLALAFPAAAKWDDHEAFVEGTRPDFLALGMLAFVLVSYLAARYININKFSLHAMYRDRLIRAYPGASNPQRHGNRSVFTGFADSDDLAMSKLTRRPFHVINTCLNLVGGDQLAWQQRKAESFTVTPLHCGCSRLGYRPSDQYGGGITLGGAVAVSGAAASPNMGYHSSANLGFIMTLLNVRLGAWLGNPGVAGRWTWKHSGPRSAVSSLLREAFGLTDDRSPYVYLSDGGHFENLGLYEMIQRRCETIVVLDGGCDPKFVYEDLGNAVRKIRIDLDTQIVFPDDGIQPLRRKQRRCAVAQIYYPDGTRGRLIYVKPMVLENEPPDVTSYADANPAFPHQSTGDQWFDESQTESYRLLGEVTMDQICARWTGGEAVSELPRHIWSEYLGVKEAAAKVGAPGID
jgi:hypothetical protein